ncbi:glycosyltransferase family 2 protein [soil metagenome]
MKDRPDVTVIVPALNEEETLLEVVNRVLSIPLETQIIVVDDGSTDSTPALLAGIKDPRLLVLRNETRAGKGSAIRKALPHARGIATIVQDADLEYSPEQIPLVVAPILHGEATVVYGTRFHQGLPKDMALPNKVVNVLLAASVNWLFRHKLTDEATCYKAFRTELLQAMRLECCRFEFCPEVTAKALRMGQRIMEIPIDYVPRTKKAGKKIRWTDAPEAFITLWKHRKWEQTDR